MEVPMVNVDLFKVFVMTAACFEQWKIFVGMFQCSQVTGTFTVNY